MSLSCFFHRISDMFSFFATAKTKVDNRLTDQAMELFDRRNLEANKLSSALRELEASLEPQNRQENSKGLRNSKNDDVN